jgi:chromosome segregation ATPase
MHSWQETNERLKLKVSELEDQLNRLHLYLDKLEAERDELKNERDQLIERLARLEGNAE